MAPTIDDSEGLHHTAAHAVLRAAGTSLLREMTRPLAPPRGATILVAVSGGADSVSLLRLLAALAPGRGWQLVVATLDHGLRGARGAEDRAFVEKLAKELGLPCRSARRRPSEGGEAAARDLRHAYLREVAAREGADAIALGHTLDDQAETVLLNLGRGAGLAGLGAMRRLREGRWRPLLGVRRARLRALLARLDQSHCEDETNAARDARRNRVRLDLLPVLEEALGPGALAALGRLADHAAEDELLLDALAAERQPPLRSTGPDTASFDRRAAANLPGPLLRRMLRRILAEWSGGELTPSAQQLETLVRVVRAEGQAREVHLPGAVVVRREGTEITLSRPCPEESER